MEQTLIANSGIQLKTCQLTLDLSAKSKQVFHEWFDDEEVQTNLEFAYILPESEKVVRTADLEQCRFISRDGTLLVSETEVLANPNIEVLHEGDIEESPDIFSLRLGDRRHCHLEALLGQWLPIPYFEVGPMGACKPGPYNWARIKVMPCENVGTDAPNTLAANVLLAFDTHAIYDEPDAYAECPSFVSDSELEKRYRLCSDAMALMDFCSGHNAWIRSYLMQMVHGVSELEDIRVVEGEYKYAFLASYLLLVDAIAKTGLLPEVRLMRDRDVSHIDVEMIVDIGNSRTAAILFEDGDFTKVKPLRLQNFTAPLTSDGGLNRTEESFDMRVAFQKVDFGNTLMSGSAQFIWPSPVRLGTEAEQLTYQTASLAQGDEIVSTYSSPKRYLWDRKRHREEWRCVRQSIDGKHEEPIIEGVSNYFSDDGTLDPDGFGVGLHYSRKTLMTFAFMEIVTQAVMQLGSTEYREFHGRTTTPRRLRKIILTCPTAMSRGEQLSLHGSLKDALTVLERFHTERDATHPPMNISVVPELSKRTDHPQWIFDEATCSQFVYLYGKLTGTYPNDSLDFFETYGQRRTSADGIERPSLIIGSLDIGAGTSDIMVCRYEYDEHESLRLKPVPAFYDSFGYAGDDMMKVLIENILIQGRHGILEHELARRGHDEAAIRKILYRFFGGDNNALSFRDRMLRRDFCLQVLVPVISHFMDLLGHDEAYREVAFDEIFARQAPSDYIEQRFTEAFGFSLRDIRWTYDAKVMASNIAHSMNDLLENVATIMYSQDCDIVILSGRPTSLAPIRDVFLKYFNGSPNRLVVLNKHRIGRWYPFANEFGFLQNSKSIVPVGAMIGYLASTAGGQQGFSLDLSALAEGLKPTSDYFVLKDSAVQKNPSFITPDATEGQLTLTTFPAYIGTKQFDLALYPVRPFYVLEINEEGLARRAERAHSEHVLSDSERQYLVGNSVAKIMAAVPLTFTIVREDPEESKERLVIAAIEGRNGTTVSPADFSLTIQSLNDPDCYWLDSGAFNINISANR